MDPAVISEHILISGYPDVVLVTKEKSYESFGNLCAARWKSNVIIDFAEKQFGSHSWWEEEIPLWTNLRRIGNVYWYDSHSYVNTTPPGAILRSAMECDFLLTRAALAAAFITGSPGIGANIFLFSS